MCRRCHTLQGRPHCDPRLADSAEWRYINVTLIRIGGRRWAASAHFFFPLLAKLTPVSDGEPSSVMIRARQFHCGRMRGGRRVEVIGCIFSPPAESEKPHERVERLRLWFLCRWFAIVFEPIFTYCTIPSVLYCFCWSCRCSEQTGSLMV